MNHRSDRRFAVLPALATLTAATLLGNLASAQGTSPGFAEVYALANNRAEAVATLIPGTEDWYYYHCRERLDGRDFDTVRKVLPTWIRRHGRTARVIEIENREALLSADQNPERTYAHLRQRLGLSWNHQRTVPGEKSDLPTSLDQELLSPARLRKLALQRHRGTVAGFEPRALAALLATALNADQLHDLLGKLRRPDVANLPALIVRDLEHKHSRGFGSMPIHSQLRRAQLDACVALRPTLLNEPAFVQAYLSRLQPRTDADWRHDSGARLAHLQTLWQFAQRLAPAHNSLKAHVLHHWLRHDLSRGTVDRDRFLTYIRLPRSGGPIATEWHRRAGQKAEFYVDQNRRFPTQLPAIGNDVALLRTCLEHLFASEDGPTAYKQFLDEDWLNRLFAETKILLGQGDMERWYSMIDDPRRIEALEKRVELTFAATQQQHFAAADAVRLEVDTKNVGTLLLKVFVIDGYRYLVEQQKDVDATIELDGLVANHEETHTYTEPALRRVRRAFDLPMLSGPGTYVVELVGNGISSRAVIHKGSLRHVERTAAAGHLFRVYDAAGTPQSQAQVWFGGREYNANDDGDILLPFSTSPGRKKAVLRAGNLASLIQFDHRTESFALQGSAFLEREQLVAGQTARLLLRPQLSIDGHPVSLQLLQDPVLEVIAIDVDGTPRSNEVRDLELIDGREFAHQLTVPDRLQKLNVRLRGKVKDLSGKEISLYADATDFAVNGIDTTAETMAALLVPTGNDFAVELRGKNGEPIAGKPCTVVLKHRDFRQKIEVALQSGTDGRIALGPLAHIEYLEVRIHGGPNAAFGLRAASCNLPELLHGRAGETLRVPYQGNANAPTRREFSLLAHDDDAFSHLALADGFLELRDLPAGDYQLTVHERQATIQVRITDGSADGEWILGRNRILQATPTTPLHLRSMRLQDGDLQVALTNFTQETRVHVVATRFQPTFDLFEHLRRDGEQPAAWWNAQVNSNYHAGRKLGDEYRYVLERRFATKFAGNMLQRPGLLLNPWALERDSWNAAVGLGGGAGGKYGARGGSRKGKSEGGARELGRSAAAAGTFANLDYLPAAAGTSFNLIPDENGVVSVPLAELGDGQVLHVVAVDGGEALYDRLVRDEQPLQPRGRALAVALPTDEHFVEQKRIEFVAAGSETVIGDARSAEVEVFDSLAGVYRLMVTLSGNNELQKFAFITTWPTLDAASKTKLYSEHACHELHFFLYQKDRTFFDEIVRPHLKNKLHRTFLDEWLLGMNVRSHLEPWAFARLNLVEKILLAQRLDGVERQAVGRMVAEQLELRPIDRERINRLFETALVANELDDEDGAGADTLRGMLSFKDRRSNDKPAATRAVPSGPTTGGPAAPGAPSPSAGRPAPKKESLARRRSRESAPAEEAELAEKSKSDDFFLGRGRDADKKRVLDELQQRGKLATLFQAVKPTKILVESNYWRLPLESTSPDLVAPNRFWRDYATAPSNEPFVSSAFVEASNNFAEMMFALAVLDLPFTAGKHEVEVADDRRSLRPATPLLLVRKEVTSTELADGEPPLLLGENFFRLDERFQFVNGEQREKFVTGEFLTATAYGAQVVVSNPTGQRRNIDVLLQIPAGALPVQRGFWTRSVPVTLNPYETKSIEYAFYFPAAGDFAHYPAHAASQGKLVAAATGRSLRVVVTPSQIDTRSWEHVSQQGSAAEVLTYLDNNNVQRLDLSKVAWRMRDREFFLAAADKLRRRHIYDDTLWSYGLLHRHADTTREYLRHADALLARCGAALRSELLSFDPIERGTYQHMEFDPLVHARAHRLGSQHVIGNADLATQYGRLLEVLGYHPRLDSTDWLTVTYYLLLQDRIEEALAAAAKVIPAELDTRVQYDYLSAYLCFFTGETARARTLSEPYRDHAVAHWQARFREVLTHLDEAEGKTRPDAGDQPQDIARQAPAIEFVLEGKQARIAYENLAQCEVRYYELDVEFAFSAQPFASTDGTTAAYVQPNLREERTLPATADALAFELPAQFHNKNVLVEVRAGGLSRSRTYFANTLDVRFLESYGQIAVTDPAQQRPLPKTYVKVFARLPNGQVRFHKDGYTDLRGRFDYASLSDDPNAGANRYAVLVLSDTYGAVIRDVAPPMQ